MTIVLTFDVSNTTSNDYNRIQSFFEQLGWENLGGTSYRYPRLGTIDQPVEDWFNHVIPALTLLRTCLLGNNISLKSFTLDIQSSTGYSASSSYGTPPLSSENIKFYQPNNRAFGLRNLCDWIDKIEYPYPGDGH